MEKSIEDQLRKCEAKFIVERNHLYKKAIKPQRTEGADLSDMSKINVGDHTWARIQEISDLLEQITDIFAKNDSNLADEFLSRYCRN